MSAQQVGAVEDDAVGAEEQGKGIAPLGSHGIGGKEDGAVGQLAGALLDARIGNVGRCGLRPRQSTVAADGNAFAEGALLVAESHDECAVATLIEAGLQFARLVAAVFRWHDAFVPAARSERVVGVDGADVKAWLKVGSTDDAPRGEGDGVLLDDAIHGAAIDHCDGLQVAPGGAVG